MMTENIVRIPSGALLVVGDLHVEAKNKAPLGQLLAELHTVISELTVSVSAVVLLGDVLCHHELVHSRDMLLAVEFIRSLVSVAPMVFVIVGNHDQATPEVYDHPRSRLHGDGSGGGGSWLSVLVGQPGITVVDRGIHVQTECGTRILLSPYVPKGFLKTELESAVADIAQADVVFAHQEMHGARMGPITSSDGDTWPEEYPLLISGHVHDNQWVSGNMFYPGVPYSLSFRKDARTSVALVHGVRGSASGYPGGGGWKKVSSPRGKHLVWERAIRTVEKRIAMHSTMVAGEAEETARVVMLRAVEGNAMRLIVHGAKEEFVRFQATEAYKTLVQRGVRVQHKHTPRVKIAKVQGKPDASLVDENFFLGYLQVAVDDIADARVSKVHARIMGNL